MLPWALCPYRDASRCCSFVSKLGCLATKRRKCDKRPGPKRRVETKISSEKKRSREHLERATSTPDFASLTNSNQTTTIREFEVSVLLRRDGNFQWLLSPTTRVLQWAR